MTNSFAAAWKKHQEVALTENGGKTRSTSSNANVDLFFKIGALRGQPVDRIHAAFGKAFGENPYIATRILLWARDVRGGAGERQIFRELLRWLEAHDTNVLDLVLPKVPELGRWDDLVGTKDETVFQTSVYRNKAYDMVESALRARNGLCAKWMPRKGAVANEMRKHFGLTPKEYRKVLVTLSDTVEQKMCSKAWDAIDYQKVPSLAQARYGKSFLKHDELRYRDFGAKAKVYAETLAKVESGELDKSALKNVEKVKINAGAVYPYDVLKPVISGLSAYSYSSTKKSSVSNDTIRAQWASLPNYMGSKNILPLIDVSGSMTGPIPNSNLTCMDVAVSLGLYMATKNRGDFHNMFLTFSSTPRLESLQGDDIVSHVEQMIRKHWDMSTNIEGAFREILSFAKKNRIPAADMPEYLVVVSDMEFDRASSGRTAHEDMKLQFQNAGYEPPKVIWWNVQSRHDDNVPVSFNASGTALVSGFSPTVAQSIISGKTVTPWDMMLKVIMDERYDLDLVKKSA